MYRWHLLRFCGFQIALHKWLLSDQDRALHDHTADNISILLNGYYREWFSHAWEPWRLKVRRRFVPYFRRAETPHRVELAYGAPIWTIWIRLPPRREWGFWCKSGWRHWKDYVAERGDYNTIGRSTVGRGCD